jgi:hypothetical protein
VDEIDAVGGAKRIDMKVREGNINHEREIKLEYNKSRIT